MKYHILIGVIFLFMLISIPVSAFEIRNGDSIVISDTVSDDLLITGDRATINAPVKSITFAGGILTVNAPVEENLIAAGGEIQVNAPVGTDVIAAGGRIDINSDVRGKVLAAGGQVTMNGETSNLAVSGGKFTMGESGHITGDALISASDYTAGGQVEGEVKTNTETGGFGPSINFEKIGEALSAIMMVLSVLFTIGMLILGIIIVRIAPGPFSQVVTTLTENSLMSFVYGIAGLIVSGILVLILLVTIIGIPIALFIGLLILICLFISVFFSGTAIGTYIAGKTGKEFSLTIAFIIGFIILVILFFIPILGFFLKLVAVCTGLGALLMTAAKTLESQA